MLRKFVIIVNDSHETHPAVAQAKTLAANTSAQIILLGVMSDQEKGSFVDPVIWNLNKCEMQARLEEHVKYLRANGIKTSVKIMDVLSLDRLFHYLESVNCDLIIVPKTKDKEAWLIESLIKYARVPVFMACSESPKSKCKNILVPLDGSPRAEISLNVAVALAHANGARLHLGHVVQQPEMPRRIQLSAEDSTMAERLIQRNSGEAKRYLKQVAASLGADVEIHLGVNRKSSSALHQMILQHNVDLLVMSAHGYSGDAHWPLGSVAENLVRYGTIPMVVVQDLPANISLPKFEAVRTVSTAR